MLQKQNASGKRETRRATCAVLTRRPPPSQTRPSPLYVHPSDCLADWPCRLRRERKAALRLSREGARVHGLCVCLSAFWVSALLAGGFSRSSSSGGGVFGGGVCASEAFLSASLFCRFFCLPPPPTRSLKALPSPAQSGFRVFASTLQSRRAAIAVAASSAGAHPCSVFAVPEFLRKVFATETAATLSRLCLPSRACCTDFLAASADSSSSGAKLLHFVNADARAGDSGAAASREFLQQLSLLVAGESRAAPAPLWRRESCVRRSLSDSWECEWECFFSGEKRESLRRLALEPLYGVPPSKRRLALCAQIVALQMAYGIELREGRQQTAQQGQTGDFSLQSLTGVNTAFRLEPPIHLLQCLLDCRIQHQQTALSLQARQSAGAASRWFVSYATSRQLSASGVEKGLRDALSAFRRAAAASANSLEQQQPAQLLHPLYGVADASCRVLADVRQTLAGGASCSRTNLSAFLEALWQGGGAAVETLSAAHLLQRANARLEENAESAQRTRGQVDAPPKTQAQDAAETRRREKRAEVERLSAKDFLQMQKGAAAAVARQEPFLLSEGHGVFCVWPRVRRVVFADAQEGVHSHHRLHGGPARSGLGLEGCFEKFKSKDAGRRQVDAERPASEVSSGPFTSRASHSSGGDGCDEEFSSGGRAAHSLSQSASAAPFGKFEGHPAFRCANFEAGRRRRPLRKQSRRRSSDGLSLQTAKASGTAPPSCLSRSAGGAQGPVQRIRAIPTRQMQRRPHCRARRTLQQLNGKQRRQQQARREKQTSKPLQKIARKQQSIHAAASVSSGRHPRLFPRRFRSRYGCA